MVDSKSAVSPQIVDRTRIVARAWIVDRVTEGVEKIVDRAPIVDRVY